MKITLKNKAIQKQQFIKKALQLKLITGAVSKQIKDCFQPIIPTKNLIGFVHQKNKKSQFNITANNVSNTINTKTNIEGNNISININQHPHLTNTKNNTNNTNHYIILNQKISMQSPSSSISTRHQSAQKYRKIHIHNPQLTSNTNINISIKQNIQDLNTRNNGNSYTIKWRNPVSNISKLMRIILGEWLMQLSHQIQIPKDAIYNAMYYTDKYVGMVHVTKSKYQSIGLCALFIASKLQLSNHPNIDIFVQAMDGAITKQQLIQLQKNMVIKLRFKLNPPTLYQYMVLILSLFNHYTVKNWNGFIPITGNCQVYMDLFWMLDGIHLDNQYKCFHNKQKVCLSILYIALKKEKTQGNLLARKKLYNDLQTLKQNGQIQKIYQGFLTNVIQITKKLSQLKDCINYYRKWVKYDRIQDSIQEQIKQLKKITLNL